MPGPPKIVTILSLDISGAFDYVSHERRLHNLRKRQVPHAIIRWVSSFLKDRQTKVKLPEGESGWLQVNTGIPQGSPISPILFLFFNADLLDTVNNESLRTFATGFVDDVNILTYGTSTERNCQVLSETYQKYVEWASSHRAKFVTNKYKVLHLTRARKRFNLNVVPTIEKLQIATKLYIRILGVQVDTKLKWGPHMAILREKTSSLLLATSRINRSTWGASMAKSKLLHSAVVKPAILYGVGVWYGSQGTVLARKSLDQQLNTIQNQFLRKVTGAYRAVNGRILEKEAHVEPITSTLDRLVAKAVQRHTSSVGGHYTEGLRSTGSPIYL